MNINDEDLVYYNDENNNIISLGYKVDSLMLKHGFSPITTLDINTPLNDNPTNNNVSNLFSNLVIPSWLCRENVHYNYDDTNLKKNKHIFTNQEYDDIIEDELYNKLLNLVEINERENNLKEKRRTKKVFKKQKNKTKKDL